MNPPRLSVVLAAALSFVLLGVVRNVSASTYVVYIPLDSPIYQELDTLNGLGYLDSYLDEIKPISRIEAARLTLEAQRRFEGAETADPLASDMLVSLRAELKDEISWIDNGTEDALPTTLHPVDRVQLQYVYSSGTRRLWDTGGTAGIHASEGTPLLPNSDGIPTAAGSNEIASYSGWGGLGGMLTGYGQVAITGPLSHGMPGVSRLRPLGAEAVLSLGNFAVSFGQQEMRWGTGHFAALSQGDNSAPIPGLRLQSIHPTLLPGFLRYLGQFRYQFLLGQLDGDRFYARPWISAQIFSFKPLPNFEFGIDHAIMFGGLHNDSYSAFGFLGRVTGLATGNAKVSNTNSRAGVYLKFRFPSLRNLVVYQEVLGEDNLTKEVPLVGRVLPFLALSYQGGLYLPRLTDDGLTDLRAEYAILEPNYSVHSDSLYWAYNEWLMGDPLGPNASQIDLAVGRWFGQRDKRAKVTLDGFYTERAPTWGDNSLYPAAIYGPDLRKEHSLGLAIDLLTLPAKTQFLAEALAFARSRFAFEYVSNPNFASGKHSMRVMMMLSGSLSTDDLKWTWQ